MNPVTNHERYTDEEKVSWNWCFSSISNGMKKIVLASVIFLFLGLASSASAQGFVPLTVIPGLTNIQPDVGGLASFFNNLYKYLIGLAAVLAIIEIIWGGLQISTQKESVGAHSEGKERITQAIFGLVLVLSPVLVFSIINPSILNLSINLPPLDTRSGSPNASGAGTSPAGANNQLPTNIDIGNVIPGYGTVYKTYLCSDNNCSGAKDSCTKDKGYPVEGFCGSTGTKDLVPKQTSLLGFLQAGDGCGPGLSPAIKCSGIK